MSDRIETIKLSEIDDNPEYNTRTKLGDLTELRDSIAERGITTPVIVKPHTAAGAEKKYRLIAGFRRIAAGREAGVAEVPATILPQKTNSKQMLITNLIENVQRESLHPLDEAEAYHKLAKAGMTVSEICKEVGKSRTYIERRMGLVNLSQVVRDALRDDRVGVGAAQEISRLPEDLHAKYVVIAEDFATGKLKEKVEKELEKISNHKQPSIPGTKGAKDAEREERLAGIRSELLDEFGDIAVRHAEDQIPNLHALDISELEEPTLRLMVTLLRASRKANHPEDDLRKPEGSTSSDDSEPEDVDLAHEMGVITAHDGAAREVPEWLPEELHEHFLDGWDACNSGEFAPDPDMAEYVQAFEAKYKPADNTDLPPDDDVPA